MSKFEITFPLIQDAIRKENRKKEWVDRDLIAEQLFANQAIIDCYSKVNPPPKKGFKWWVGNEVDFFSKEFTEISETSQEYITEFERMRVSKRSANGIKRKIWAYRVRNASIPENVQIAEEIDTDELTSLTEGSVTQILVNKYERNLKAREKCINHHGLNCKVCGFNFKEYYGEIGENFIHVHHLKALAEIGKEYEINPVTDLIPVCANCHSMLHMRKPPYTIEELKEIISKQNLFSN